MNSATEGASPATESGTVTLTPVTAFIVMAIGAALQLIEQEAEGEARTTKLQRVLVDVRSAASGTLALQDVPAAPETPETTETDDVVHCYQCATLYANDPAGYYNCLQTCVNP